MSLSEDMSGGAHHPQWSLPCRNTMLLHRVHERRVLVEEGFVWDFHLLSMKCGAFAKQKLLPVLVAAMAYKGPSGIVRCYLGCSLVSNFRI